MSNSKQQKVSGEITVKMSRVQNEDGTFRPVMNIYHYPEIPITITKEFLRSHQETVLNVPEPFADQTQVLLLYQQELRDYLEAQTEYSEDDLYDAFAYYWLTGDCAFFQRFCAPDLQLHQEKPEVKLHIGSVQYLHQMYFGLRMQWHQRKNIAYKVFMGADQNHPDSKYILCRLATGGEAFHLEMKHGKIQQIFQKNNFRAEKGYYDNYSANLTEFIDSEALEGKD